MLEECTGAGRKHRCHRKIKPEKLIYMPYTTAERRKENAGNSTKNGKRNSENCEVGMPSGAGNRRDSGDGGAVRHRLTALCSDERQLKGIYRDDSGSNDHRGAEYFDGSEAMKQEKGSIGDILSAGICMLAMTVLMFAYMDDVRLIHRKSEVSQIARQYILKMETVGYLTEEDRIRLGRELDAAGVTELELAGTTMDPVAYGDIITLEIKGRLEGEHDFVEKRISTAKH